ncbi:hypothetical protein CC1G_06173 [Coprinopsis cinerea okayama7|uniref:C2H2-type domain-containing protein n=1 Tax=Coprinopsis cinerea (strain Okayama-7 / 130 / ATCC MYA-4618 / FGSC 9003) TaxID=240176 RepID=A8NV28_COPC7|nr:hypothetical protein CC1G_06173 [Coprinopsis cinerea okayama7\|eukprot:XP_001836586.1 hypothetical protein CC1G_06173 [Coprinopsis cinerea okayama7\
MAECNQSEFVDEWDALSAALFLPPLDLYGDFVWLPSSEYGDNAATLEPFNYPPVPASSATQAAAGPAPLTGLDGVFTLNDDFPLNLGTFVPFNEQQLPSIFEPEPQDRELGLYDDPPIFTDPFKSSSKSRRVPPGSRVSTSTQREIKTIRPQQILLMEDRFHGRAEDALMARVNAQYRADVSVKPEPSSSTPARPRRDNVVSAPSTPLKRPLSVRESPAAKTPAAKTATVKTEVIESISSYSRASRYIAPLPRRASVKRTPSSTLPFLYPQPEFVNSPISSSASLSHLDSDYEFHRDDDDSDFLPSASSSPRKKQKRAGGYHLQERKGKKTQLQIVLEDLPFTLNDILYANGLYHCPFSTCGQTTTSEGDLGRHLESSIHATHRYICLAPQCLSDFAREDSMKRHHGNNRGRNHKADHDRLVRQGFAFRVKIKDVSAVKEQIKALQVNPIQAPSAA